VKAELDEKKYLTLRTRIKRLARQDWQ
jgi:hypothetical protein